MTTDSREADETREATLVERAVQALREALPNLVAVYLFGSRAKDQATNRSDIDLAVFAASPVDPVALYRLARDLEVRLDLDVDLIDLARASTVLQMEVLESDQRVYCRDPDAALDFEARVLTEYGRYREMVEPILASVRESGRAYDRE